MVWHYGGAGVWWACEMRWQTGVFWPFTNRHVTLLLHSMPGLKPKPQGATPQPKPTRNGDLGVLPQSTPKPPPHTPRPNIAYNIQTIHSLVITRWHLHITHVYPCHIAFYPIHPTRGGPEGLRGGARATAQLFTRTVKIFFFRFLYIGHP
ncbi:hypothetical protein Hanom_Chr04g00293451 [Helianthus anomalus]